MRAFAILILAGLVTSGCASVAERTARNSGAGFTAAATTAPAPSQQVEGNYRQALFDDLAS